MKRTMINYILAETLVSIAINVAISIGFVFAQFHGQIAVPTSGPGGLIRDAIPQTFAISLMSVLVPTLLTRKRGRSGALAVPLYPRDYSPKHVLLRAIGTAIFAALVGLLLTDILFTHATAALTFAHTLAFKACYGALVALVITPLAVHAALHDVAVRQSSMETGGTS